MYMLSKKSFPLLHKINGPTSVKYVYFQIIFHQLSVQRANVFCYRIHKSRASLCPNNSTSFVYLFIHKRVHLDISLKIKVLNNIGGAFIVKITLKSQVIKRSAMKRA